MTDTQYRNQLEAICFKLPHHELLGRLQRGGNTALNRLLLKQLMEKMSAKHKGETLTENDAKAYAVRITNYHHKRARLSNTLLDLHTKAERAAASREIDAEQAVIQEIQISRRRWAAGDQVADAMTAIDPMTPLKRRTRIQSLRSMRSRWRKQLAHIDVRGMKRKNAAAIEKARRRLDEIEQELSELDLDYKTDDDAEAE